MPKKGEVKNMGIGNFCKITGRGDVIKNSEQPPTPLATLLN